MDPSYTLETLNLFTLHCLMLFFLSVRSRITISIWWYTRISFCGLQHLAPTFYSCWFASKTLLRLEEFSNSFGLRLKNAPVLTKKFSMNKSWTCLPSGRNIYSVNIIVTDSLLWKIFLSTDTVLTNCDFYRRCCYCSQAVFASISILSLHVIGRQRLSSLYCTQECFTDEGFLLTDYSIFETSPAHSSRRERTRPKKTQKNEFEGRCAWQGTKCREALRWCVCLGPLQLLRKPWPCLTY